MFFVLILLVGSLSSASCSSYSSVGPWPIEATWMRDRFTRHEWDDALAEFAAQGGKAVWQRAQVFRRHDSANGILDDQDFDTCRGGPSGSVGEHCVNVAKTQMQSLGVKIASFNTYSYEENYGRDGMILCPEYDVRIDSSRVFYRLTFPRLSGVALQEYEKTCTLPSGTEVDLVFTFFSGIDAHSLLVQAADNAEMEVYLGLPANPSEPDAMSVYYNFVRRVVTEYSVRYRAHSSLKGFYYTTEAWLGWVDDLVSIYQQIADIVHKGFPGKAFVLSPYVDLNFSQVNSTVEAHKEGFKKLGAAGADVIAVQEGRGCAKGSYWWQHEAATPIIQVDPVLDAIVRYLDPKVPPNVTFAQQFTASNRDLFSAFADAVEELKDEGVMTELWLNVEAFEYLRDAPCLPVDPTSGAMGELLDRTNKIRLDRGLLEQGIYPRRMISFAWDACYLCMEGGYQNSLAAEIRKDADRPIISSADYDAAHNQLSLLGFNLAEKDVAVIFEWMDTKGSQHVFTESLKSMDPVYGATHNRSYLLQQAQTVVPPSLSHHNGFVQLFAVHNGKRSYHPFYIHI